MTSIPNRIVHNYEQYGARGLVKRAVEHFATVSKRQVLSTPGVESLSRRVSEKRLEGYLSGQIGIEDAVQRSYSFRGIGLYRSIAPEQHNDEYLPFLKYIDDQVKPQTVVEIGTSRGGSLVPWLCAGTSPKTVVSIDFDYKGRNPEFYHTLAQSDTTLHTLKRNSQTESTRREVENLVGSADFIFIDGDHSYEGVRKDWENWKSLSSDDGVVGFHDIIRDTPDCGVGRLWKELKEEYETQEFVCEQSRETGWCGLGIVTNPD